jgi:glycosyltransferase involved in cell wall biosynthesis
VEDRRFSLPPPLPLLRTRCGFGCGGFSFWASGRASRPTAPTFAGLFPSAPFPAPPLRSRPYTLWVPKWYPNPNDDQDGNFVEEHARALHAVGGALAVVFGTYDPAPTAPLLRLEATEEHGFPVVRAFYRQRLTGWALLDRGLKLVLYFWGLTRAYHCVRRQMEARPALVHVHVMLRTGLWARVYRALTGIPYLVTEHWTLYRPENAHRIGWLRRRLSGWVTRGAAAVLPVSHEMVRAMQALGLKSARYEVVPNVVDTALYHPTASAEPPAPPTLLHVAVFNEAAKNASGLLRTFAKLHAAQPEVRLVMAGYGPAEAQLHVLATELGLLADEAVRFTGKLDRPAVAAEMRRATAFVLFSHFENLPCVLIEALASGLPVVATTVGGIPELVDDGQTGYLVPPADEAALLAALRRILTPEGRATLLPAPALQARAEARYSLEAVGQQLLHIYATV